MNVATTAWRLPRWLPALILIAAVMWVFRDTAMAMVVIWWRSETYTHAFLVPPIALWLAWRQRAALARVETHASPWMLLPIAAACLLWLMAELATVAAASQFMLVCLVVMTVPAVFGWPATRLLLFPLGFLFFSVPVGEFLVPTLIDQTADFTVSALRLTGIPVYREGNEFVIPSGSWSVIEACSGVRYLIASLMVGTLYAYLNYQRLGKRLIFVAVAIVVPIVANWLRAYMIVMIGHLSGNTLAVGVDHLIYGWVFFGVVIGLMFMIGARWADPEPARGLAPTTPASRPVTPVGLAAWLMMPAIGLLVFGTQGWLGSMQRDSAMLPAPVLQLPGKLPGRWTADVAGDLQWTPGFINPSAVVASSYRDGNRSLWLWVGYYRGQGPERKLVSSSNLLVADDESKWALTAAGTTPLRSGATRVRTGDLREAGHLTGALPRRLRVWQLYWIDGRFTASEIEVKLRQSISRLRGDGDDGAVLLMATPLGPQADATLDAFTTDALPRLDAWLQSIRSTR